MQTFSFHNINGFGQTFEDIRANDLDHALRIMAQRLTGTRSAKVRKEVGGKTFTLFGKKGDNLGKFTMVDA